MLKIDTACVGIVTFVCRAGRIRPCGLLWTCCHESSPLHCASVHRKGMRMSADCLAEFVEAFIAGRFNDCGIGFFHLVEAFFQCPSAETYILDERVGKVACFAREPRTKFRVFQKVDEKSRVFKWREIAF